MNRRWQAAADWREQLAQQPQTRPTLARSRGPGPRPTRRRKPAPAFAEALPGCWPNRPVRLEQALAAPRQVLAPASVLPDLKAQRQRPHAPQDPWGPAGPAGAAAARAAAGQERSGVLEHWALPEGGSRLAPKPGRFLPTMSDRAPERLRPQ